MKKPYIFINCAMSLDGKIASPSGKQIKISCDEDIKRMYELRNKADAVLAGINTVLSDNPKLTVKNEYVKNPKQPTRIVLDTNCKTPEDALVVNDVTKTYLIVGKKCLKKYAENVEIIECKTKNGLIDLHDFSEKIYKRGVKKLMVEGGSKVITNFLNERLVDDIYIYVGSMIIGGEKTPSLIKKNISNIKLKLIKTKKIGKGVLLHYKMIK